MKLGFREKGPPSGDQCPSCSVGYSTLEALTQHLMNCHPEDFYEEGRPPFGEQCSECSDEHNSIEAVIHHMRDCHHRPERELAQFRYSLIMAKANWTIAEVIKFYEENDLGEFPSATLKDTSEPSNGMSEAEMELKASGYKLVTLNDQEILGGDLRFKFAPGGRSLGQIPRNPNVRRKDRHENVLGSPSAKRVKITKKELLEGIANELPVISNFGPSTK